MKELVVTVVIAIIVGLVDAQYGYLRGIGEPCVEKPTSWNSHRGTCDEGRGFSCQDYPAYGGFVCACTSPFAYDPHSDECRRSLGGSCQHSSLSRRPGQNRVNNFWYDKCQQNAECTLVQGVTGRAKGLCTCKRGYYPSYGGDFCEK